ncbi:uncharacterized protein LOC113798521 [Dermatophagoides pteronyssinus]|uniref:uncharacterized protein LOC113798521 n=1 Tax=Dermatophagoides pteronyssinus TaxID=6956 RepID=UPI003F669077
MNANNLKTSSSSSSMMKVNDNNNIIEKQSSKTTKSSNIGCLKSILINNIQPYYHRIDHASNQPTKLDETNNNQNKKCNIFQSLSSSSTSSCPLRQMNKKSCSFVEMLGQIISNVFKSIDNNDNDDQTKMINNNNNNGQQQSNIMMMLNEQDELIFKQYQISKENVEIFRNFRLEYQEFFPENVDDSNESLTDYERLRLEQLDNALDPLRYSIRSRHHLKNEHYCNEDIHGYYLNQCLFRCPFNGRPQQSNEELNENLYTDIEFTINMLITLAKQIKPFNEQSCNDQISLLQQSVMPIMTLRSLLLQNRKPPPLRPSSSFCSLKRQCSMSDDDNYVATTTTTTTTATIDDNTIIKPKTILKRICLDAVRSNESQSSSSVNIRPSCIMKLTRTVENSTLSTCSNNNNHNSELSYHPNEITLEHEKHFQILYQKLFHSIDDYWLKDKYIFYLLFVIVLFQPSNHHQHHCSTSNDLENVNQIREEHYRNLHLLQRYLRNQFVGQPNARFLARSHFVRLFDLIQQVYYIHHNVIQKLWSYNLKYAHNLWEKLCAH